jgi:hypothetical protein
MATNMSQYIGGKTGISLPLSTTFAGDDGESMAGKCIAAPAGLPGFMEGCAAGPSISAYASKPAGERTGGGGTARNADFKANNTDNLDGDGN